MPNQFKIRRMNQEEVARIALPWAVTEGWNPGLYDAICFYGADPQGFFVGELNGKPIAIISAVAYDDYFAFMGFYIVKPDFRNQGYGMQIWHEALNYLGKRNIGGDGVLERIKDYETQGFRAYYKNRRYQGMGLGKPDPQGLKDIQEADFGQLVSYDGEIFPAQRSKFLKCWISQPQTKGYCLIKDDKLLGYGVIRPCYKGYKIGPLFADNSLVAEKIFNALIAEVPINHEFFFDAPEVNPEAVGLAEKYRLKVVFETARIYSKALPPTPLEKVYGVTSFELG